MTNLQTLQERIAELVPSVSEKELCKSCGYYRNRHSSIAVWITYDVRCDEFEPSSKFEPICLADVLLAIEKTDIKGLDYHGKGVFYFWKDTDERSRAIEIKWNLSNNRLSAQDPATIQFLSDILINE